MMMMAATTSFPSSISKMIEIPQWMIEAHHFRRRLFLRTVEPIIVFLLGPVDRDFGFDYHDDNMDDNATNHYYQHYYNGEDSSLSSFSSSSSSSSSRRRLSFLPSWVDNPNYSNNSHTSMTMTFATLTMMYIIMSVILLVFLSCFYHNQKTSPLFVSPRRHRLPKLVPPPLPVDGAFRWMKVCLLMSDEEVRFDVAVAVASIEPNSCCCRLVFHEVDNTLIFTNAALHCDALTPVVAAINLPFQIINRVGFDALIFLRFHRLALRCIVKMSIFSFLVLLPLNFTGGESAKDHNLKEYVDTLLFTDFLLFTMANVSSGSNRLWVHCFAAYLQTIIVVRELLIEYNAYSSIRHRYLLSKEPHLRTVLVSNIPRHLRSPRKIGSYFRHVYPEAVKSVTICQNLIKLEGMVAERTAVLAAIEKELLILCRCEKRKLLALDRLSSKISSAFWTCHLCEKIGVIDEAQERISKLYVKLEEMNKSIDKEQTRRRLVMQHMDRIGAGEGREEIDYTLASAFNGDCPTWKKALRQRGSILRQQQQQRQQHLDNDSDRAATGKNTSKRSTIGAPRNGDGSVRRKGAPENPEAEVPPSNSPTNGEDDADRYEAFLPTDGTQDANMKRSRRLRFSKAKTAIKRYSSSIRDASVFGRSLSDFSSSSYSDEFAKSSDVIEDHINEVTDKAFVVMRTFTASTIAIQSMHSSKPGSMEVSIAPEPRDILWENVYFSKGARRTRTVIAELFCLFLISFYIVPVALISLLVSERALITISPRLNH